MNTVKEKNIVVCIILSLVTCGIYGIVWFINLTDDMKRASGDESLSGVKALLLTLVTCGIYGFFWVYKMGKASYQAEVKYGLQAKDNSTLYLILQIFGLGIVNYCLIQSDLNNISKLNSVAVQPTQNIGQDMTNMNQPMQNFGQDMTNVNQPMQSFGQDMTNVNQPMQNVEQNVQNPDQSTQNPGV